MLDADDEVDAREAQELVGSLVGGGRYQLGEYIGKGGMGLVFRAKHRGLNSERAVKILLSRHAASRDISERLVSEARLVERLRHPNIVEVSDVGEDGPGGRPYLVMEFLQGESLASYLRRASPLSVNDTASIIMPVIDALVMVHEQTTFHRDLKPDNIFLQMQGDRRVPKILDFGIAKHHRGGAARTQSGQWLGTVGYTRPGSSSRAGQETDQFSVGAILYECLTGRQPFCLEPGESLEINAYYARVNQTDKFPRAIARPDVPAELEVAIRRMLDVQEANNYRSMRDARQALDQLFKTAPISSSSAPRNSTAPEAFAPTLQADSGQRAWTAPSADTAKSPTFAGRRFRFATVTGAIGVAAAVAALLNRTPASVDERTAPTSGGTPPSSAPGPKNDVAPRDLATPSALAHEPPPAAIPSAMAVPAPQPAFKNAPKAAITPAPQRPRSTDSVAATSTQPRAKPQGNLTPEDLAARGIKRP